MLRYEPGESETDLCGGSSNWRGSIWFPTNSLLIKSLQHFHHYYGDDFKVEYPTLSGQCLLSSWPGTAPGPTCLGRAVTDLPAVYAAVASSAAR
jgi:hypothetical protein